MALKSLSALATAIAAVKKEAGDFAEYKPLLDALTGVSKELGGADAAGDAKDGTADAADDAYSFKAAEDKHKASTAARIEATKAADKPTPGDEPDPAPAQDGSAK